MPSAFGRTRRRWGSCANGNKNGIITPTGRGAGAQTSQGRILDRLGEVGAVSEPYAGGKVDVEDGWPVRAGNWFGLLLLLLGGRRGEMGAREVGGGGDRGGG